MLLKDYLNTISFPLLKSQKADILILIDQQTEPGIKDSLTGILHLIDDIQEKAVDICGYPENVVFDISED